MQHSIIFTSPLLMILYGVALVITLLEKRMRTGAVLPWMAAILVMTASGLMLILGASLMETASAIVFFLIIGLIGQKEGNG